MMPVGKQQEDTCTPVNGLEVWQSKDDEIADVSTVQQAIALEHAQASTKQSDFYGDAQKYWSQVPATVNGMLGGLGYISTIDIQGSNNFLRTLKDLGNKRALDCGAGIGRVSKNLLIPRFATVDLVEQDSDFALKAKNYCIGEMEISLGYNNRLGDVHNIGLQQFFPEAGKYDLVWSQWVLGHLTDSDLLKFFIRIRQALSKNGYFVLKENVSSSNKVEKDVEDSSVTRPLKDYENALRQAEFRIVRSTRQQNFPKGLYPVYMIACRPKVPVA